MQPRVVLNGAAEIFEAVEARPHTGQDLARLVVRYACPHRQTDHAGPVGDRQENDLEQGPQSAQLVGVHALAQKAQLFGGGEVEVAAFAGRQQVAVVRQDGGNSRFLLSKVAVGEGPPERRLDQVAYPLRRPEHEAGSRWRISGSLGRVGVE